MDSRIPADSGLDGKLVPIAVHVAEAQQRIARMKAGTTSGLSTGFSSLDPLVRLTDGELLIIAARPAMGKTALAMQVVLNASQASKERGVWAIYSAEMSGWSLSLRLASAVSGINTHRMKVDPRAVPPDQFRGIQESLEGLKSLPIWINDQAAPTTTLMVQQLSQLSTNVGLAGMMFDYVELGGDRGEDETRRVGKIALALKDIAKQFSVPVVALSQLNRGVEGRENKAPAMGDLRQSGTLEAAADCILMLMRPQYYLDQGMNPGVDFPFDERTTLCNVVKGRDLGTGRFFLQFNKRTASFSDS